MTYPLILLFFVAIIASVVVFTAFFFSENTGGGTSSVSELVQIDADGNITTPGEIVATNIRADNKQVIDQTSTSIINVSQSVTSVSTQVSGVQTSITNAQVQADVNDVNLETIELNVQPLIEKTNNIENNGTETIFSGTVTVVDGNVNVIGTSSSTSGTSLQSDHIVIVQNPVDSTTPAISITQTGTSSGDIVTVTDGDANTVFAIEQNAAAYTSGSVTSSGGFVSGTELRAVTFNVEPSNGDVNILGNLTVGGKIECDALSVIGIAGANNLSGENRGDQLLFTTVGGVAATEKNDTLTFTAGIGVNISTTGNDITFSFDENLLQELEDKTQYIEASGGVTTFNSGVTSTSLVVADNLPLSSNYGDQNLFSTIAVNGQPSITADSTTTVLNVVASNPEIIITESNATKTLTIGFDQSVLTPFEEKTVNISATSSDTVFTGELIAGNLSGFNSGDQLTFTSINGIPSSSGSVNFVNGGGIIITPDNTNKNISFSLDPNELQPLNNKTQYITAGSGVTTFSSNVEITGTLTANNVNGSNTGDQNVFTTIGGVTANSTTTSLALTGSGGINVSTSGNTITYSIDSATGNKIDTIADRVANLSTTGNSSVFAGNLTVEGDLLVPGDVTTLNSDINIYDGSLQIKQNPTNNTTPALEIIQTGSGVGPIMTVKDGDSNTIFSINQDAEIVTDGGIGMKGELQVGDHFTISNSGNIVTTGEVSASNISGINTGDQFTFTTVGGVEAGAPNSSMNVDGSGYTVTPGSGSLTFEFNQNELNPLNDKTQFISVSGGETVISSDLDIGGELKANNVSGINTGDQLLFNNIGGVTASSITTPLNLSGSGINISSGGNTITFSFDDTELSAIEGRVQNITTVTPGVITNFGGDLEVSGNISGANLLNSNSGDQFLFNNIGGVTASSTATSLGFIGDGINIVSGGDTVTFSFNNTELSTIEDRVKNITTVTPGVITNFGGDLDINGNISGVNLLNSNTGDQFTFTTVGGVEAGAPNSSMNINGSGYVVTPGSGSLTFTFDQNELNPLNDKTQFISVSGGETVISSDLDIGGELKANNVSGINTGDQLLFNNIGGVTASSTTTSLNLIGDGINIVSGGDTVTFSFNNTELSTIEGRVQNITTVTPGVITNFGGDIQVSGNISGANLLNSNTGDQNTFTQFNNVTINPSNPEINFVSGTGVVITGDDATKSVTFTFDSTQLATLEERTTDLSANSTTTTFSDNLEVTGNISGSNLLNSNSGDQLTFTSINGIPSSDSTITFTGSNGIEIAPGTNSVDFSLNLNVLDTLNSRTSLMTATSTSTDFSGAGGVEVTGVVSSSNLQNTNTGDQILFSSIGGVGATTTSDSIDFIGSGITIAGDDTAKTVTFTFDNSELNQLNEKTTLFSTSTNLTTIDGDLEATGVVGGSNVQNTNTGDQLLFSSIGGVTATSTTASLNLIAGTGITIVPDNSAKSVTFSFDNTVLNGLVDKTQHLSANSTSSTFEKNLIVDGNLIIQGSNTTDNSVVNIHDGYVQIIQNPADGTHAALDISQIGTNTGSIMKVIDGDTNTIFEVGQDASVTTDGTYGSKGTVEVNSIFSAGANVSSTSFTGTELVADSLSYGGSTSIEASGFNTSLPIDVNGELILYSNFTVGANKFRVNGNNGNGHSDGTVTAASFGGIAVGDLPNSGIDAEKFGSVPGLVSNTEFGYLNNASGPIQAQIDGKTSDVSTLSQKLTGVSSDGTSTTITGGLSLSTATVGGNVGVNALTAGSYIGIQESDLPSSGIDAAKFGSIPGLVSNTEFGYLQGTSGPIQSQIDSINSSITPIEGRTTYLTSNSTTSTFTGGLNVTGTLTASSFSGIEVGELPTSGIDAEKFGSVPGLVSNTEFGYLNNASGPIQAQIDGKSSAVSTLLQKTTGLDGTTVTGGLNVNGTITASSFSGIDVSELPTSGIDAEKFGSVPGLVSNTEFGYLNNASGPIQAQIDSKSSDVSTLSGKLTGVSSDGTSTTITGEMALSTATVGGTLNSTTTITAGSYSGIQETDIPSGIDASKIAGNPGPVSSTVYDYLQGLTSNIQTTINGYSSSLTSLETKTTKVSNNGTTTTFDSALSAANVSATTGSFSTVSANNVGTFAALNIPTAEKVIYVSQLQGNNSNNGFTPYNAKATIGGALSAIDGSGWLVVITPGIYNEAITVSLDGVTLSGSNYETGGSVSIPNTITVNSTSTGVELQGLSVSTLVLSTSGTVLSNYCKFTTVTLSGSGNYRFIDVSTQGPSNNGTVSVTGAATVVFDNCLMGVVAVNNSSSSVTITNCISVFPTTLTAGKLLINNSTVYAANGTSNAIATSVGTTLVLTGVTLSVVVTNAAARMSVAGSYSFGEVFYDNSNSTITGMRISVPLTTDQEIVQNVNTQSYSFNKMTPTTGAVMDLGSSTSSILLPKGTDAQRPTGVAGMMRYNTTSSTFEGYTNAWGSITGGGFSPTIVSPGVSDILTYDTVSGVWINSLVPVKSLPSISVSEFTVTVTAPVFIIPNVAVATFKIQVATDTGFTSLVYDSPFQAGNTFGIGSFVTGGTTYYIRGLVRTDLNNKLTQWSTAATWVAPTSGTYAFATRLTTTGAISVYPTSSMTPPNTNITKDSSDNIYYYGRYGNGPLTIYNSDGTPSGITLASLGQSNLYLAKYNPSGACLWAARMTADSTNQNNNIYDGQISIDGSGNVYLSMLSFGNMVCWNSGSGSIGPIGNSGVWDAYFTKYNPSGTCQWLTRIAGATNEFYNYNRITTDSNGNSFVTVNSNSSSVTVFNNGGGQHAIYNINTTGNAGVIIVKYNTSGIAQWGSYTVGNNINLTNNIVRLDGNGDVYTLINYSGTSTLVSGTGSNISLNSTGLGTNDLAIVKYSTTNGAATISRIGGTINNSRLAIDSGNNVIVSVNFTSANSAVFNPGSNGAQFGSSYALTGTNDGIVAKFNSSLTPQWVSNWKPVINTVARPNIIVTDSSNNIFVCGYISGNTQFTSATSGNTAQFLGGTNTCVIVKYDSNGSIPQVARSGGSSCNSLPNSAIVDNQGNVYISNYYVSGSLTVTGSNGASLPTLANTNVDIAFVKFNNNLIAQWANRFTNPGTDDCYNMLIDSNNILYVTGYYGRSPLIIYNSDGTTEYTRLNNANGDLGSDYPNVFIAKIF